MRPRIRTAAGLVVAAFALAAAPAQAATVTLANGNVVEGTIQGQVLIARQTPDGTPAFRVIEGKDITRIDATGVHADGQSVMLMGMKPATMPDVLEAFVWWEEGRRLLTDKAVVRRTRNGEVIGVRVANDRVKAVKEELAGTSQIDPAARTIVIVPSLRVQRSDGSELVLAVKEVVPFTAPGVSSSGSR